jgi:toxin ParE1/3/4
MTFEFHPEARVELTEAALHYDRQVHGLGERLVRRVVDLLTKQPHIGIPADPNLHKFVLTRFPFILYYSFTGDVLRIEAVAHQSRRPGYWKDRVTKEGGS